MIYYGKSTIDSDKIINIYRHDSSPTNYVEEIWNESKKKWLKSDLFFKYLSEGEPTLVKISSNVAKSLFPNAF